MTGVLGLPFVLALLVARARAANRHAPAGRTARGIAGAWGWG